MTAITGTVNQANNYLLLPQGSQGITIDPEFEKMLAEIMKRKAEMSDKRTGLLAQIASCENEGYKSIIGGTINTTFHIVLEVNRYYDNSFNKVKDNPYAVIEAYNDAIAEINEYLSGDIRDGFMQIAKGKFEYYLKDSISTHCENVFSYAAAGKLNFSEILTDYNNLAAAISELNLGIIGDELMEYTNKLYMEQTREYFINSFSANSEAKNNISFAITFAAEEYSKAFSAINDLIEDKKNRDPFIDALDEVYDKFADWSTEAFVSFLDAANARRGISIKYELDKIIYSAKGSESYGEVLRKIFKTPLINFSTDEQGEIKIEPQRMNYMSCAMKEQITTDIRGMFDNAREYFLKNDTIGGITHEAISGSSQTFQYTDLLIIQNELKQDIDNFVFYGDKTSEEAVNKLTGLINQTFMSSTAKKFLCNMIEETSTVSQNDKDILDELYEFCAKNKFNVNEKWALKKPSEETMEEKLAKHDEIFTKSFAEFCNPHPLPLITDPGSYYYRKYQEQGPLPIIFPSIFFKEDPIINTMV